MTADKIKAVAMSLFARHGYEATSLADIAKEVGIKKPSIYNHFKGKEDLFLSVFDDVMKDEINFYLSQIKEVAHLSTENKLYSLFKDNCERYGEDDRNLFWKRAIFFPPNSLQANIQSKFTSSENTISKHLTTIFEQGINSGVIKPQDLSQLLAAYYCLIDGLFLQYHYYHKKDFQTRIESVWNIFWEGIKARN